jgi:hypothetical protein
VGSAGIVKNEGFDHMTVVVTDLGEARRFFGLLGFVERIAVVASGEMIARYMGIPEWEADHVTLVLEGAPVHQEVQLLYFHHPTAAVDAGAGTLTRTGFNHVCFRCWPTCRITGSSRVETSWTSTNGASSSSTARASWWSWPSGSVGQPARAVT